MLLKPPNRQWIAMHVAFFETGIAAALGIKITQDGLKLCVCLVFLELVIVALFCDRGDRNTK